MAASWRSGIRIARHEVTQDFSAVLLVGGKSSRMGRDKAFIEIEGVPLWQRQLQTLTQLAPKQIFLAGPARPEWVDADCETIADEPGDIGPLGGLMAALERCVAPLLLALAVDLPHITSDFLGRLVALSESDQGTIPNTGQLEPLAAIYPISAWAIAEAQSRHGDYSLQTFARRCVDYDLIREHLVAPPDAALFLNLNTPADLEKAMRTR